MSNSSNKPSLFSDDDLQDNQLVNPALVRQRVEEIEAAHALLRAKTFDSTDRPAGHGQHGPVGSPELRGYDASKEHGRRRAVNEPKAGQ